MPSSWRNPRFVVVYAVQVLLIVISGLLLLGGQPLYGFVVLALATILNVRMLMQRNRRQDKPQE